MARHSEETSMNLIANSIAEVKCLKIVITVSFICNIVVSHVQLPQDSVLLNLKKNLFDNWRISFKQDTFLIFNDDSITVHFVNVSFWTETNIEFEEDFIRSHGNKKPLGNVL